MYIFCNLKFHKLHANIPYNQPLLLKSNSVPVRTRWLTNPYSHFILILQRLLEVVVVVVVVVVLLLLLLLLLAAAVKGLLIR